MVAEDEPCAVVAALYVGGASLAFLVLDDTIPNERQNIYTKALTYLDVA